MKTQISTMLIASLLGTSAVTVPALAQDQMMQAPEGQECEALEQFAADNANDLRSDWVTEADQIVVAGDAEQCALVYEEAAMALDRSQSGEELEGADAEAAARVLVTQPDPEVTVQQSAPEVSVTQPEAQVRVDQGRPQVIVRQQQPTVRVQIPQPVITIDQPQPEIIVRMPDPDVAVSTPDPEIEVQQSEPTVSVEQAEPQIQVDATESVDEGGDIQIEQENAQVVQQQDEGEPQIQVETGQPQVQYESAEPNIEVETEGEPQVQFNQTGEPEIRYESMSDDSDAAEGQQTVVQLLQAGDPNMDTGEMTVYVVSDVIGQDLYNAEDTMLGTVERMVSAGDTDYVVLGPDSRIGDGQGGVVLPVDNIIVMDDRLVLVSMTDQDISDLANYDPSMAQELTTEDEVEMGTR
ncbi:hypothetical protein GCM10007989_12190 [Devosia pacifica]|uniref:PRC-barrel domain-containing protein n=1 Tax=Devosia pacifica TaxID=1335967 RepID=A0A918S348_9HYPH|nr:PRC-barrel domain-containing protein [Devosia pacifica]GHA18450.1 hypothetical protein GCM10007989_12190 [Devosia pacifica]